MKRWVVVVGVSFAFLGTSLAEDKKPASDPQFIEADDVFFVPHPANMYSKEGQVRLGKLTDEKPTNGGKVVISIPAENEKYEAKTTFKTRIARPEDLFVGRRIIYPRSPIKTKADKNEATVWNYRYIANLADAPKGQLIVAGRSTPLVDLDGIRVITSETDTPITLTGKEDVHSFRPQHWLVYTGDGAPDADGHDTTMALAINAPAKAGEEGTFLVLATGKILKTKYAYRSRPATKADLKAGLRIALFTRGGEAPKRDDAYLETWYVGNLASYTNGVAKMSNATVRVEMLRVIE